LLTYNFICSHCTLRDDVGDSEQGSSGDDNLLCSFQVRIRIGHGYKFEKISFLQCKFSVNDADVERLRDFQAKSVDNVAHRR